MRSVPTLSLVAFAFAATLAACGGGGGGSTHLVPAAGGNASSGGGNTNAAKTAQATIVVNIPPPNRQAARHPFYISSSTQSFGVLVAPVGSTATPSAANAQIFPVTTPSPCAAAGGGGDVCTFVVTAPIGEDVFYVATWAVASPGPNFPTPLSEFASGAIDVGASPSPGATPIAFTLNAVPYSVTVAVASPDPNNTPNTQVFTVGVPTSAPLAVTAYDSSGTAILDDPATQFAVPIALALGPASDGLSFSLLAASQCGSTVTAAVAAILCAGDLNDVQVVYDGKTYPDGSDHVVDTFSVAASQLKASPAPSPANFVLASNVLTFPVPAAGNSYLSSGWMQTLASGQLLFVLQSSGSGGMIGTFDPSTSTVGTVNTMSGVSGPSAIAVAPNGEFFIVDQSASIDCWSSTANAEAGAAPAISNIVPQNGNGSMIYLGGIAVDRSNNLWYVASDSVNGQTYLGYFSTSSGCPSSPSFTNVALTGDFDDSSPTLTALANVDGVAFLQEGITLGMFVATTSSGASVNAIAPVSDGSGYGLTSDALGNAYATFDDGGSTNGDLEKLPSGGSALSTVLDLVPYTGGVSYPEPYELSAFSPNGGAADRLIYADVYWEAMGVVGNLTTAPTTFLATLPDATNVLATAHGAHGEAFILFDNYVGGTYEIDISRVIDTHTWSAPVTQLEGGCYALVSVNERGDSGPFTLNPAPFQTMAGGDHDFIYELNLGSPFTVTITDKNGRSQTVTFTPNSYGCG